MTKRILPGLDGTPISSTQAFSLSSLDLPGKPHEHFYGGGRIMHSLKDGDSVPVGMTYDAQGGVKVFSECVCDFNKCDPAFEVMNQIAFGLPSAPLQGHIGMGIDPTLVKDLWAMFAGGLMLNHGGGMSTKRRNQKREKKYTHAKQLMLSQIARSGHMACAEMTVLGKKWLERRGHNVSVFNHAFRYADHPKSISMHAMIVVEMRTGGILLVDPTNQALVKGEIQGFFGKDGETPVPQLYLVKRDLWERMKREGKDKPALIALDTGSVWTQVQKRERAYAGFATLYDLVEPEKALISAGSAGFSGPETSKP